MSASLIPAGIDAVTRYLDLAGVCSCALLGGAVARTAGLDLFGFLVVGIISGLGGGMIRDVLLQHGTAAPAGGGPRTPRSDRPVPRSSSTPSASRRWRCR
ncbi:trimeric intracellular cation channel family protein [Streptomyces mirabilis]|uniref:trimeric intracellular cation channel family protein n=1 Tax=Streptomyces mirabilis TaxID=68239 RepID=UPI0036455847